MKKITLLISIAVCFLQVTMAQEQVTIINPSFELPDNGQKIQDPNLMDGWHCDKQGGTDSGREADAGTPDGAMRGFSRNTDGRIYQPVDTLGSDAVNYNFTLKSTVTWNNAPDPTSYCTTYFSVMDQGADFTSRVVIDSLNTEIFSGSWIDVAHLTTIPGDYEGKVLFIEFAMNTVATDPYWAGYDDLKLFKATGNVDPMLSSLSISLGELTPEFDPAVNEYEADVPFGTTEVTITAVSNGWGSTVTMFDGLGNEVIDGVVSFSGDGIDVEIIVTALDGTQVSYYVSIFVSSGESDARLRKIDIAGSKWNPTFSPDIFNYEVYVPKGTTSVDVSATAMSTGATVTGGGTVELTDGVGSTTITVTSQDGSNTNTYTLNIYTSNFVVGEYLFIQHEASQLVIGETGGNFGVPQLNEPIRNMDTELFKLEESGVEDQYYLKSQAGNYIALSSNNTWNLVMVETLLQNPDSCRFVLNEFELGRFTIRSVIKIAANPTRSYMGTDNSTVGSGIYIDKYGESRDLDIWSLRPMEDLVSPYDTYLSDLTVDAGNLRPAFGLSIKDYYVTLPEGTTSLTITAGAHDPTSTVSGAGTVNISGDTGTVTITVTASDPSYTTDYRIHYILDQPLSLRHSYTFADGTAKDVVSGADGEIRGGEVQDGVFVSSVEGDYIVLPGEDIGINQFPSITLEAYVNTSTDVYEANNFYTMLAYFGGLQSNNALWMQLSRQDAALSRFNFGTNGTEVYVSGPEPGVGENHHYVMVVTSDSLYVYIDGAELPLSAVAMEDNDIIANIDPANAWLCYGGWSDPTWLGSMYEFNIYSGAMDAQEVATRSINFPVEDGSEDATLSALKVGGDTIRNFAPYRLAYDSIMDPGVVDVPVVEAITKNPAASAVVTDATELPGTTTILVTAADGVTTNTYTVEFKFKASDDATLSDLTVDGSTVDEFDPGIYSYDVELPYGTTVVPAVAATTTDANATVVITDADQLPGTTTVEVTAEDGETMKTYVVNFSVAVGVRSMTGNSNIKVYPTLSREGHFMVQTEGGMSTISLYNLAGVMVLKTTTSDQLTEITTPQPGMYILRVEVERSVETFRIIHSN